MVPHWFGDDEHDGFQHYSNRDPIWIKSYTRLLSDDAYLALTAPQRAVLHGVWLEYARSNRKLSEDTCSLSRKLGVRVTKTTLEALNHAGFIVLSASSTLADGYQSASADQRENREEEEGPMKGDSQPQHGAWKTASPTTLDAADRLAQSVNADELATLTIRRFAGQLPEAAFHSLREKIQLEGKAIRSPAGYAINGLRSMVDEKQYEPGKDGLPAFLENLGGSHG